MGARLSGLEADIKNVKAVLNGTVVPLLSRIDERLNHTATKAELQSVRADLEGKLAEKPGKGFIVGTALSIVVGGITLIAATIAGMQYLQGGS